MPDAASPGPWMVSRKRDSVAPARRVSIIHLTKPVDPVLLSEMMMARSGRGSRARIANQSFLEQPIAGEDERADPGQPQGH
jgi:hypothetical protein